MSTPVLMLIVHSFFFFLQASVETAESSWDKKYQDAIRSVEREVIDR
jgi:hypothetical protein